MKLYSKMQQLHFCSDRTNKSSVFRIEAEMSVPIRDEILLDALKKALALFPTAACRPFITPDKKRIGMKPNPAPPVIYHEDVPLALGTDETNGYLFRVISMDHTIIFSVFHALFDARGAHLFMVHLLYFYLIGMGYEIDPEGAVMTPEDLDDPAVTATLEQKLEEAGITGGFTDPDAPGKEMFFHDMREEELYDTDIFSMTRVAMPFAQLKQLTRQLNTTPMLLFYVLGSQAMRETADVGDKVIYCCFAADLRSKLNSRSQEEFGGMGSLFYTREEEQLSLGEQLEKAKAALDRTMSGDGILRAAKDMLDGYDAIVPYMDFTMMAQMQPILSKNAKANSSTFFLTNIGPLRFPKDMTPYIRDVQLYGAPAKFDPTVGLHTYGDTLYLNYIHNTTDDAHVDRLTQKLTALGVDCNVELKRTYKIDHLGTLSLENDPSSTEKS